MTVPQTQNFLRPGVRAPHQPLPPSPVFDLGHAGCHPRFHGEPFSAQLPGPVPTTSHSQPPPASAWLLSPRWSPPARAGKDGQVAGRAGGGFICMRQRYLSARGLRVCAAGLVSDLSYLIQALSFFPSSLPQM